MLRERFSSITLHRDERGGQEPTHAEVEDQASLDDLDHLALDGLAALRGGLDALPCELEASALLRELEPALRVLFLEHERIDLVADGDLVLGVDRAPNGQLGDGDHALRLPADVDEHLVLVHAHDLSVHDLALLDLREGGVVIGDELPVRPGRPDARLGGLLLCVVCHEVGGV